MENFILSRQSNRRNRESFIFSENSSNPSESHWPIIFWERREVQMSGLCTSVSYSTGMVPIQFNSLVLKPTIRKKMLTRNLSKRLLSKPYENSRNKAK